MMGKYDDYEEIGMDEVWDFEVNKELVGKLVSVEEAVGPNNSMLYTFEVDGKNYSVWGSSIIDARLKNARPGDDIVIIYKGKVTSEKTKRTYKDYKVLKKSGGDDFIKGLEKEKKEQEEEEEQKE